VFLCYVVQSDGLLWNCVRRYVYALYSVIKLRVLSSSVILIRKKISTCWMICLFRLISTPDRQQAYYVFKEYRWISTSTLSSSLRISYIRCRRIWYTLFYDRIHAYIPGVTSIRLGMATYTNHFLIRHRLPRRSLPPRCANEASCEFRRALPSASDTILGGRRFRRRVSKDVSGPSICYSLRRGPLKIEARGVSRLRYVSGRLRFTDRSRRCLAWITAGQPSFSYVYMRASIRTFVLSQRWHRPHSSPIGLLPPGSIYTIWQ